LKISAIAFDQISMNNKDSPITLSKNKEMAPSVLPEAKKSPSAGGSLYNVNSPSSYHQTANDFDH
jgi:broad specificity polyphosphatase/5'/3'-nucleotidase SurE